MRSFSRRLKMSNSRSPLAVRSMTIGIRGMEHTLSSARQRSGHDLKRQYRWPNAKPPRPPVQRLRLWP